MLERVCRQQQEAEERETGEGSDSGTPRWVPRWLNLPSPRQKSPTAQLGAEQQLHAASLSPRRPSLSPHRVPRGPTAPLPSSLPSLPSSRPSRRALPTELSPPPPSSPWVGAQSMAAQLSSELESGHEGKLPNAHSNLKRQERAHAAARHAESFLDTFLNKISRASPRGLAHMGCQDAHDGAGAMGSKSCGGSSCHGDGEPSRGDESASCDAAVPAVLRATDAAGRLELSPLTASLAAAALAPAPRRTSRMRQHVEGGDAWEEGLERGGAKVQDVSNDATARGAVPAALPRDAGSNASAGASCSLEALSSGVIGQPAPGHQAAPQCWTGAYDTVRQLSLELSNRQNGRLPAVVRSTEDFLDSFLDANRPPPPPQRAAEQRAADRDNTGGVSSQPSNESTPKLRARAPHLAQVELEIPFDPSAPSPPITSRRSSLDEGRCTPPKMPQSLDSTGAGLAKRRPKRFAGGAARPPMAMSALQTMSVAALANEVQALDAA